VWRSVQGRASRAARPAVADTGSASGGSVVVRDYRTYDSGAPMVEGGKALRRPPPSGPCGVPGAAQGDRTSFSGECRGGPLWYWDATTLVGSPVAILGGRLEPGQRPGRLHAARHQSTLAHTSLYSGASVRASKSPESAWSTSNEPVTISFVFRPSSFVSPSYSGILPCFLGGLASRLFCSTRSASMSRGRVSCGSMTSSM